MKASYRWLRALVPALTATPKELAERLTHAGLEVEATSTFGAGLEPVVVAAVRKIEPHPSKSGLRLVTVDRGGGHEQRVVCGAPNVPAPGGLVVLAPLGTHLPAKGVTLTAREIGGVVSEGMLCSEEEMGLVEPSGAAHGDGILVLPPGTAEPGARFLEAVPAAHDTIFEIGVTPNRPDALGHLGIARDVAALYGLELVLPATTAPAHLAQAKLSGLVTVTIDDFERCPHYGAAAVLDVAIGPSPAWLRYRLASLGVRPISNVVDVTNLLLLEYGHPMHAFDLDRVRGSAIVVRRAKDGEQLLTLDGVERRLDADDLVICDGEGPVALAGIMGGGTSEIGPKTKRVLLECAWFSPRGIRRSSRRHGLHTESSHRFERGVDTGDVDAVLARASALLSELAGGAVVPGVLHVAKEPPPAPVVTLRSSRLDALLGVEVPFDEAVAILGRLGFHARAKRDGAAELVVPTHRPDVSREADLVEEVARIRGLDRIPTVLPPIRPQPPRDTGVLETRVRRAAVELGLSEAIAYSFRSPRELAAVGAPEAAIIVANPLGEERSVMRTSLLPGLLEAVARAHRHGETRARLFSVGPVFLAAKEGKLADEHPRFAAIVAGERDVYLGKPQPVDAWDAKGLGVELAERVTGRSAELRAPSQTELPKHLHPRGAAEIVVDGVAVGRLGPLHPDVSDALDVGLLPVQVVELDLRALGTLGKRTPRFVPIPRLPAVTRDVALVVHEDVVAGEIERVIRDAAGELCESVEVFDLFRGGAVPKEHKSLAFHVVYRDPKAATAPSEARTLTDQEVDRRHEAVVTAARKRFGAELRGG